MLSIHFVKYTPKLIFQLTLHIAIIKTENGSLIMSVIIKAIRAIKNNRIKSRNKHMIQPIHELL
jgi:hypothetical protein